jgi:hypothetical protein
LLLGQLLRLGVDEGSVSVLDDLALALIVEYLALVDRLDVRDAFVERGQVGVRALEFRSFLQ